MAVRDDTSPATRDDSPDAVIVLDDATVLTKGGAEKSIEAKQRPYD
ncbi:putative RiPP precursor [Jiangella alba]|uniref:Uncharacterized protein n=1 Tax=Jiangella alba TaxID=561176 RepID=A0A1H5PE46_9ACTN|nr:putative RiPP precursor [Jiangella alba]SEF12232.1 hypothetical protein SAMN04488561_4202 [Jiangella alba]